MNYLIKICGQLDPGWSAQLGGMEISMVKEDGALFTLLTGTVADQPALFGILDRLRDMNLLPILVEQIEKEKSTNGRKHVKSL
ncbi:MAG TPA: hypothetical protein VMS73_06425 [Anaerolineaceae bacterium]|nr:hypothetical protein [Anaerolineaceae bacterium]